MPQLAPDMTLALSRFIQSDAPGLVLMYALQVESPSGATIQPPVPDTVQPTAEPACG
jgi:hypothetical protein